MLNTNNADTSTAAAYKTVNSRCRFVMMVAGWLYSFRMLSLFVPDAILIRFGCYPYSFRMLSLFVPDSISIRAGLLVSICVDYGASCGLSSVFLHVFIYLQYVLSIYNSVLVHVLCCRCISVRVLHEVVDCQHVLRVDCSVVVHVFHVVDVE